MKIIRTINYKKLAQQKPIQWNQEKNKLFEDANKNPYKQNTQNPVIQQNKTQLSRDEVIKTVKALRTLAMNISYFREKNTLALTGWINQESKILNTFLEGVENNQLELDKALPFLARRVINAYKYVSKVWKQIGKNPLDLGTLKWLEPFVYKWVSEGI